MLAVKSPGNDKVNKRVAGRQRMVEEGKRFERDPVADFHGECESERKTEDQDDEVVWAAPTAGGEATESGRNGVLLYCRER